MKTQIEEITPKKAEYLLNKYWVKDHQRKISPSVVASYARAMRAGLWTLTHQGICIDDANELVDGVHRLKAIQDSGVTIRMMVTTGMPHNGTDDGTLVIDAIDRGRPRSVGQQLQLRHEIPNGNLHAAVTRGILWLCTYSEKIMMGMYSVGNSQRVDELYGAEVKYCVDNRSRDYGIRNAPVIAACAFAMKPCTSMIREFYSGLVSGENLKTNSPALTCRRWIQQTIPEKSGYLYLYRGVLTCAMKHITQESISKIYDTEHGYNFFLEKQRQSVSKLLRSCGFIS